MDTIGQKLLYTLSAKNAISSVLADANIEVPQAFGDYAATISANIGNVPSEEEFPDIEFIDYDGRRIASYTFADAAALTALPELPAREGFTNEGWNYSLNEITSNAANSIVTVAGCTYITTDGATKIYFEFPSNETDGTFHFAFLQTASRSILVDWGDGTTEDFGSTSQGTRTHNYDLNVSRSYVITITNKTSTTTFALGGAITDGFFRDAKMVKEIKLGRVRSLGAAVFQNLDIPCVSVPKDTIYNGENHFNNCDSQTAFVFGSGISAVQGNMFKSCPTLNKVSLPSSVNTLGQYSFSDCPNLTRFVLPPSISSIRDHCFYNSIGLKQIDGTISGNIEWTLFYNCGQIEKVNYVASGAGSGSFYKCHNLKEFRSGQMVTSLGTGDSVFEGCTKLSSIGTLDVELVPKRAFYDCPSLDKLVFSHTGELSVAENAFNSSKITTYDFRNCNVTPVLINGSAFTNTPVDKKIIVPDSLYDYWTLSAANWKSASLVSCTIAASDYVE